MKDILGYGWALLWRPGTMILLLVAVAVAAVTARPLSRLLRWSAGGAFLVVVSTGGALAVTLGSRIWQGDFHVSPAALVQCANTFGGGPDRIELQLNLLLLVPLGFALYLASRSLWQSVGLVLICAGFIEASQAVFGLGACEVSDLVRNVAGGVVAVGASWLLVRVIGDRLPRALQLPAAERTGQPRNVAA